MASKIRVPIDIITCPEWGAIAPKHDIVIVGKAVRTIFHHTAGHHRELDSTRSTETEAEAIQYAKDIQHFHMFDPDRGWADSGHNFLVLRNGPPGRDYAWILQGRWQTVSAIQSGRMVESAHCPGQNDQIGIEHEHVGVELMTEKQFNASARLMAWIAGQYGRTTILTSDPHSKHFGTRCPENLVSRIQPIRRHALEILRGV